MAKGGKPRLFYGWWVVFAASVGLCFSTGTIVVLCLGVFFQPLSQYFQASRGAVSLAFTLHNLLGAVWVPVFGRMIDRFGPRRVILTGSPLFAMVLISSTLLPRRIVFLYLFFLALGLIAGSTSPVPYGVVVSRWFDRRRGLALGLMMFGLGIGAIALPLIAHHLIVAFNWQVAYAVFGGAVLLVLPVLAVFIRNDPRDLGLLPDNAASHGALGPGDLPLEGLEWREIRSQPPFWFLTVAFFLIGASVHACVIHMPSLLHDRGASAGVAAVGSSIVGLALMTGRILTGFLLDRFFAPRLAVLFFAGVALGILVLWSGSSGHLAMVAAFLIGLGMGAEADLIAFCMSRYFGLRAFGTAFAYGFGAFVLGGAIGTLVLGALFDSFHSYTVALGILFAFVAIGIGLMTRLGPYRYVPHGP